MGHKEGGFNLDELGEGIRKGFTEEEARVGVLNTKLVFGSTPMGNSEFNR